MIENERVSLLQEELDKFRIELTSKIMSGDQGSVPIPMQCCLHIRRINSPKGIIAQRYDG